MKEVSLERAIAFLKANRSYGKFRKNLRELGGDTIQNHWRVIVEAPDLLGVESFLDCGFHWYETPEGDSYWRELEAKWQKFLKEEEEKDD